MVYLLRVVFLSLSALRVPKKGLSRLDPHHILFLVLRMYQHDMGMLSCIGLSLTAFGYSGSDRYGRPCQVNQGSCTTEYEIISLSRNSEQSCTSITERASKADNITITPLHLRRKTLVRVGYFKCTQCGSSDSVTASVR